MLLLFIELRDKKGGVQMMKKYQLNLLIIFQIICIIMIIQGSTKKEKIRYIKVNTIIMAIIIIIIACIYLYIARKFWMLKKYIIYKAFSILNVLYAINIIGNFIKGALNIEINYILIESVIIGLFLIGNVILIATYNRNVRVLKSKEN